MSLAESLGRLYALAPRGARFGLEAMRAACAREGNPQDAFVALHVAGTNGKGSVCAMLEGACLAAGMKVGLYTSPHLQRFAERVRIFGATIDDALLARHLSRVLDDHPELTFFEVATLVGFLAFREAGVEVAVVEVGLGGRLDATNVMGHVRATAVTSIALDHMAILGDTIEAIAREKAGILKHGVPLVVGRMPPSARETIEARAHEVGASPVWRLGQEIAIEESDEESGGGHRATVPARGSVALRPKLAGAHQIDNAAVAAATAWASGLSFDPMTIASGIAQKAWWPGRLEEIHRDDGVFLLDGAHNEEGALALARALAGRPEPIERRALVFGTMGDKRWQPMVDALAPAFAVRRYVAPNAQGGGRRATSPETIAAYDRERHAGHVGATSDIDEALRGARERVGRDGIVVVAGSLYLVGEARARLLGEACDPHVGL